MTTAKIIWTKIDEAPALATYSLLPIVQAFTRGTGIDVETRDISLVGRIIANFPDNLTGCLLNQSRAEDAQADDVSCGWWRTCPKLKFIFQNFALNYQNFILSLPVIN